MLCETCRECCVRSVTVHVIMKYPITLKYPITCGFFLYCCVLSVLTITRRAESCVVEDCGEEPLWACESALLEHSSCTIRTTEGFPIFREVTAGFVREIPNLD